MPSDEVHHLLCIRERRGLKVGDLTLFQFVPRDTFLAECAVKCLLSRHSKQQNRYQQVGQFWSESP